MTTNANTSSAVFQNNSATCSYLVGLAIYKEFDSNIDNQEIADFRQVVIPPSSSLTLTVSNPACAFQSDAFSGNVLLSFAGGVRYGSRLLDSDMSGGSFCTLHCLPSPTPTSTSTPTRTPTNPPTSTPTSTPSVTPTKTPTPSFCPGDLVQNPSFEILSGTNSIGDPKPTLWVVDQGESGATTAFHPPNGARVGYVWGLNGSTGRMYQKVTAIAGNIYSMSFFSGTHNPSVQPTIEIRFYNVFDVEIGTAAIHTITTDIDITGALGGPYSLTATAPAGVSYLKVIFRDPSTTHAGAKGDSLCLTTFTPTPTKTPTATPTKTTTPTPVPPTPTKTPTPQFCVGDLVQNASFETLSGTNSIGDPIPTLWVVERGESGATTGFNPPNGSRVGYVWGLNGSTGRMSQQVSAVAGKTYTLTFYSGTHNPSVLPSIEIRFYNSFNVEIGTAAIHTITTDIDVTGSLGGPYTLNATAPSGVSYLKVIFRDPSTTHAGAKGDALCLRSN